MTTEMKNNRSKKGVATGLIIIGLGVVLLLRKMDVIIPNWVTSWQMILIFIGAAIGISSNFRKPASWILMGLGAIFLINDIFYIPFQIREYFWPLLIIGIGFIILIRPRKKKSYHINSDFSKGGAFEEGDEQTTSYKSSAAYDADKIDSVSIFNGLKRRVQSRRFKGGEAVTVFGGTEINLLDADFEGTIELESVVIFGGMKLIVPPNWEVRNNVNGILGGVEDKRSSAVQVVPDDKVIVLTGTVVFGGLDIVNY